MLMLMLKGTYTKDATYTLIYKESKTFKELRICDKGTVISAYKETLGEDILNGIEEFCFGGYEAKNLFTILRTGINAFNLKKYEGTFVACPKGSVVRKTYALRGYTYTVDKYNRDLYGCDIQTEGMEATLQTEELSDDDLHIVNAEINYIHLTKTHTKLADVEELPVRSVEEISLYKDTTWLRNKKYYVVTEDKDAEDILTYLINYKGPIAYDTETTGLRINMFSKVNGEYAQRLKNHNALLPRNKQVQVDKLVGVIFCIQPNVSYYFPCANRKFKNLYESGEIREKLITNFKAFYTVGEGRNYTTDMARYWRSTPSGQVSCDCIFMERCRPILEKGYIVTHNGTFDWKVAHCYDIDTNISDDTMIMHQLMYKYRYTTSNKGESSALKHLAQVELGIDQLSLEDFFVGFSEKEDKGRLTEKRSKIDFSYMTYDGAMAYAPADGDMTLSLYLKYKKDMLENYKDIQFIYGIELLVSCAIGYMEFYGHRIDEHKIATVREEKELELLCLESEIRDLAHIRNQQETDYYNALKEIMKQRAEVLGKRDKAYDKLQSLEHSKKYSSEPVDGIDEARTVYQQAESEASAVVTKVEQIKQGLLNSMEEALNLSAANQVADLFYNKLKIPFVGDKPSVAKNSLKPLMQEKEVVDGVQRDKYPIVKKYREWKDTESLISKFFGSLPDFMYPGGFIFSHYGQIQAATGRMSCSRPNAQQYCKAVTKIVVPRGNNVFFDADYSQIEYRTLVALADEPGLKKQFEDPDSDYHTSMASLMFDIPYEQVTKVMRSSAKSFNFGIPYGMGLKSLAVLLHGNSTKESVDDAAEKYELYFKNQPNVRKFFARVKESAVVRGKTETLWKRKRFYTFTDSEGREDSARKASALRQAGNAVIQGTAADIFKISVARNWNWIRANKLYGKVIIVNMIHDEQLIEIDCDYINVLRAFADIVNNMQFKIEGFPPLYVGGGVGPNWNYAKGGDAEVHPVLAAAFAKKAEKYSLFTTPVDKNKWLKFFDGNVKAFRCNKVASYFMDEANWGKAIHPAILSLLTTDFTYGATKGEDESDSEFLERLFNQFCAKNNIEADYSKFRPTEELMEPDEEEDEEYSDDEEMDELDIPDRDYFELITEQDDLYGIKLEDLIQEFGVYVSKAQKVCGVRMDLVTESNNQKFIDYIQSVVTDDPSALQLCLLDKVGRLHKKFHVKASGIDLSNVLGFKNDLYN